MRSLIAVFVLSAAIALPAAAASWGAPRFGFEAAQKGRPGHERGPSPRDFRPDRQPERGERRERFNEDERRALHRDLDKANRELYQRRHK